MIFYILPDQMHWYHWYIIILLALTWFLALHDRLMYPRPYQTRPWEFRLYGVHHNAILQQRLRSKRNGKVQLRRQCSVDSFFNPSMRFKQLHPSLWTVHNMNSFICKSPPIISTRPLTFKLSPFDHFFFKTQTHPFDRLNRFHAHNLLYNPD